MRTPVASFSVFLHVRVELLPFNDQLFHDNFSIQPVIRVVDSQKFSPHTQQMLATHCSSGAAQTSGDQRLAGLY